MSRKQANKTETPSVQISICHSDVNLYSHVILVSIHMPSLLALVPHAGRHKRPLFPSFSLRCSHNPLAIPIHGHGPSQRPTSKVVLPYPIHIHIHPIRFEARKQPTSTFSSRPSIWALLSSPRLASPPFSSPLAAQLKEAIFAIS